jgi:hypothetical protein
MKTRALVFAAVVACAAGWTGRSVFSEDPPAGGGMDAAKLKEAWMKLGTPGEEHARLQAALAGEWDVHGKFTGMDGKVSESDSTSSIAPIMGGRFLQQTVNGSFEGQPFEGRGVMGYDNGKKKWVGSWVDNMGTGIWASEGVEKEKGKVWEFSGSFTGPGGVPMTSRDVMSKVGDDELRMESYMGGGKDPMMVLVYKRKK